MQFYVTVIISGVPLPYDLDLLERVGIEYTAVEQKVGLSDDQLVDLIRNVDLETRGMKMVISI